MHFDKDATPLSAMGISAVCPTPAPQLSLPFKGRARMGVGFASHTHQSEVYFAGSGFVTPVSVDGAVFTR